MSEISSSLITYCTNIHRSDTWVETFAALQRYTPAIKAAISPENSFPIGLRLSQQAAIELNEEENEKFIRWLQQSDCYVSTINGFSYGSFHGERVKEQVYLPDWRSPDRTIYSICLANLLARWLPKGMLGSISTVPIGFKETIGWEDMPLVKQQIMAILNHLSQLKWEQGKEIVLALEPEPGCLLETTEDICRFFEILALPDEMRNLIGICYDCCHQAIEFEDPAESLKRIASAGIRIAKVQVSSALSLVDPSPNLLDRFNEPRYMHQVVIRGRNGAMNHYHDLPNALIHHSMVPGDEWRCHFHVPIFIAGMSEYGTTQSFLEELLPLLPSGLLLEVETYTWDVLPPELRRESVTESIIRELQWLESQTLETYRRN